MASTSIPCKGKTTLLGAGTRGGREGGLGRKVLMNHGLKITRCIICGAEGSRFRELPPLLMGGSHANVLGKGLVAWGDLGNLTHMRVPAPSRALTPFRRQEPEAALSLQNSPMVPDF